MAPGTSPTVLGFLESKRLRAGEPPLHPPLQRRAGSAQSTAAGGSPATEADARMAALSLKSALAGADALAAAAAAQPAAASTSAGAAAAAAAAGYSVVLSASFRDPASMPIFPRTITEDEDEGLGIASDEDDVAPRAAARGRPAPALTAAASVPALDALPGVDADSGAPAGRGGDDVFQGFEE